MLVVILPCAVRRRIRQKNKVLTVHIIMHWTVIK